MYNSLTVIIFSLQNIKRGQSQKHMTTVKQQKQKRNIINLKHHLDSSQRLKQRKKCTLMKLDDKSIVCLLGFLRLGEIVHLYESIYDRGKGKEMGRSIVNYLMMSGRSYSKWEQEEFVEVLMESRIGRDQVVLDYAHTSLSTEKSRLSRCQENIRYDVQRTYLGSAKILTPSTITTKVSIPEAPSLETMQDFLNRILLNVSKKYPQVGYVQGLNYIVKTMYLTGLSEEHAYEYLCFFLERRGFARILINGMIGLKELAYALKVYIFNYVPIVYKHFLTCDVDTEVFATSWFITLFSEDLPICITNKIWHLFALEGWKTLIQFSIAVLCTLQPEIISKKNDQIFPYLRTMMRIFHEKSHRKHQIEQTIWKLMGSIQVSNEIVDLLCGQMEIMEYDCQIQLWRVEAAKGKGCYQYYRRERKHEREDSPTGRACCEKVSMNPSVFPFCHNVGGRC